MPDLSRELGCDAEHPHRHRQRPGRREQGRRPQGLQHHRRLGEPRLAPDRPGGGGHDPGLGAGPPAAGRSPGPCRGRRLARSKGMAAPVRAFRVVGLREAPPGRAAVRRPPGRAAAARERARGLPRQSAAARRCTSAARPASARPAWSRNCSGMRPDAGLRLPQGAGAGFRRRRRPGCDRARSCAACSASARRATRRRPAPRSKRAVRDGLLDSRSQGLPERSAGSAAADGAARALRRDGQRRAQPRQAGCRLPSWSSAPARRRRGCHRRGRPLGGRADARPPRAPRPDRRQPRARCWS